MKKPACPERWTRVDGSVVSCKESVKVLNENWNDIAEELQNVFEDALLMGCSKACFREEMKRLIDELECDYVELTKPNSQK